ncbi:MAG TPA: SRPBCC family protein [Gemmatimonadaceae bacterium]|nr:SRPBCC family protein [Gemmatimonadaceae bacterium]
MTAPHEVQSGGRTEAQRTAPATSARSARPRNGHRGDGWRHRAAGTVRERVNEERLANALGWFAIGLGLAQVAAPGSVARLIGVRDDDRSRNVMRGLGMREMASGVGILTRPRPAGWLWARVAGDVMDLALLGTALNSDRTRKNRAIAATAAVAGVTALDVLAGEMLRREPSPAAARATREREEGVQVTRAITIMRSPEEIYAFWRNLENLPRFMRHLESVRAIDERRSHWTAKGPGGKTVEWDAEITEDLPNELIAWRSLPGADVQNSGSVRFSPAPADRGTAVTVEMRYAPPAGKLGVSVAKLFHQAPGQQMADDLRLLKQVIETGEIVRSDASIAKGPHPAQPSEAPQANR